MIAALMVSTMVCAQKEKVTADVNRVTIFTNGAQVERSKTLNLLAGEQTVVFTGLSPYTDVKSMQLKAYGKLTVLSINHRYVHPDSLQQVKRLKDAEQRVKSVIDKSKEVRAKKEVLEAQLAMVQTNCSVGNRTAVTPLAGIKELNNYYSQELLSLKKQMIALDEELISQDEERVRCEETRDSIAHLKLKTVTEIEVKVDLPQAGRVDFNLTYYVKNAGWFPTYDVRAVAINQPMQLSYKANVFQNTKEDWHKVPVTLSSANPNRSTIAPELQTYWLDYGRRAPRYDSEMKDSGVSGIVTDEKGDPIAGALVQVKGSSLGTVTDFNGRYSITLPRDAKSLQFSFIGYISQTHQVHGPSLNVSLKEDMASLQEVVATGSHTKKRAKGILEGLEGRVAGVDVKAEKAVFMEAPAMDMAEESQMVAVQEQKAQFGYEFEIKQPLTILSDGKTTTTEIGRYQLPATYQYKGIPRADKDAFLVADATDWQQLSLLEGEANVYFENSFVGKSILDPTQPSDTLHFSLGRDNGIRIQRTKVSEKSVRRLLASSQEQNMTWRILVKNTRKETVSLLLQDQIPVSRNSDISVTTEELSGGTLNKEQGIVSWQLQLQPGEQRELILQYKVKYPKSRKLIIE